MPNAKCQVPSAKCQVPSAKCQVPNAFSVDLHRFGDHAFIFSPGHDPLQPDLHLSVSADQVSELGIRIARDANDQLRHLASVAPMFGAVLDEFGEALAALLVR